jgi:MoaA/NifB/PqqE/SkfB family radical SAM enzyme
MTTDPTPYVPFLNFETLWFQSGGTICNLRCNHCFISCSPENHTFEFMPREQIRGYLDEARDIGSVKSVYHTGGEPFINRDMTAILADSLQLAETTVLTNGTLITPEIAAELKQAEAVSPHRLWLRVSIDSYLPEKNDEIRGEGVFVKAMRGARLLSEAGFEPIITMMRWWDSKNDDEHHISNFEAVLREHGVDRAHIKILPALLLGEEEKRSRGYNDKERLTQACVTNYDFRNLQCSTSRMVTARGVWVCPILVDDPTAKMGETIRETFTKFPLTYAACYTCRTAGLTCSNPETNDKARKAAEAERLSNIVQ